MEKVPITVHPRFGHKISKRCLLAKLNSKNDIQVEGIFHPSEMHWVTNPDDRLHSHMDTSWVSCYQALTKAESLNKGILSEIVPTDLAVCRQQWSHEDHWKMPNPLIDYNDPYYDNHDSDVNADIDEEWFQGRDG